MKVPAPHNKLIMNVECQSYRNSGVNIDGIVLHTTEGFTGKNGLRDMGDYFDHLSTQASSHRGIDRLGRLARYVPDSKKAWTCMAFNSCTLNVEIIGFSSMGKASWWHYPLQLRKVAYLVAYWADEHSIPLRRGHVDTKTARFTKRGVVRHMDLGQIGGGHSDPGSAFPIDWVIRRAKKVQKMYHNKEKK